MSSEPESSDRRNFPRLKDSCSLRFKVIEADGLIAQAHDTHTVNISGGGICFRSPESLASGTVLVIELELPGFDSSVIALGRVLRCDPTSSGGDDVNVEFWDVGMEFWWIGWDDDGAQRAISDHIKKALES